MIAFIKIYFLVLISFIIATLVLIGLLTYFITLNLSDAFFWNWSQFKRLFVAVFLFGEVAFSILITIDIVEKLDSE